MEETKMGETLLSIPLEQALWGTWVKGETQPWSAATNRRVIWVRSRTAKERTVWLPRS